MKKFPMTPKGKEQLQDELTRLKTVDRPQVIAAIAEARGHGDLKENAEYHAAKEQQGFLEARIRELEGKLAHCQVIDVMKLPHNGRVVFGTTVVLIHLATKEKMQYRIVGDEEADLKQERISVNSPIARALIGKDEGDVVTVQTPTGEVEYAIHEVLYLS